MADLLAGGPEPDKIACLIQGWGSMQLVYLSMAMVPATSVCETTEEHDRVLYDYIVACRDEKRALGLLEKCLDKVGSSSPASAPLAELVALVRHEWDRCDAILGKIPDVSNAVGAVRPIEVAKRLRMAMSALWQATTERQRGGAVNARGGSG